MKDLNNARLRLEIAWCRLCDDSYPIQLDLALLAHAALVLVSALPQRTADEVARRRWRAMRARASA